MMKIPYQPLGAASGNPATAGGLSVKCLAYSSSQATLESSIPVSDSGPLFDMPDCFVEDKRLMLVIQQSGLYMDCFQPKSAPNPQQPPNIFLGGHVLPVTDNCILSPVVMELN